MLKRKSTINLIGINILSAQTANQWELVAPTIKHPQVFVGTTNSLKWSLSTYDFALPCKAYMQGLSISFIVKVWKKDILIISNVMADQNQPK